MPGKLEFTAEPTPRADASIFDLVNAVNAVLQRFTQREDQRDIFQDKWSVSEKIEHLMRMTSERPRVKFSELFEGATSRSEVVVTFLALLELIRLKQLTAVQTEAFGEIEICRISEGAQSPTATSPAAQDPAVSQPSAESEPALAAPGSLPSEPAPASPGSTPSL